MSERERYENGIFTVRFIGDDLDKHGVSIYDLSQTLIAMQRIVHKAYLAQHERLEKGAFPNKEERKELALQLGERRRSSDAFALVPLLSDPGVQSALKQVADYVISGIVGYYVGDVLERAKKEPDGEKQIFIGSIYGDVVNIVNRIDSTGGVDAISIGAPALGHETVAAFTPHSKEYLGRLKGEVYLGRKMNIKGKVYRMYPSSRIVSIRRAGGKKVDIFLNDEDFEKIRYHPEENPYFVFHGRPRFRLGIETMEITEFEAERIELALKRS
ncbi:MAG: hypothetical protein AMXMBFR76_13030 [Pseudomonadota bacterium]